MFDREKPATYRIRIDSAAACQGEFCVRAAFSLLTFETTDAECMRTFIIMRSYSYLPHTSSIDSFSGKQTQCGNKQDRQAGC